MADNHSTAFVVLSPPPCLSTCDVCRSFDITAARSVVMKRRPIRRFWRLWGPLLAPPRPRLSASMTPPLRLDMKHRIIARFAPIHNLPLSCLNLSSLSLFLSGDIWRVALVGQVCVLCEADYCRRYEQDMRQPPSLRSQSEVPGCHRSPGALARHSVIAEGPTARSSDGREARREAAGPGGQADGTASGNGDWLSCLRRLYAAVPPEWLSTVELVLEQTLHQMPAVAESLLSVIQQTIVGGNNTRVRDGGGGGGRGGAETLGPETPHEPPPSSSGFRGTATSISQDLGLLLLLLREASPLRACSLPLLPVGMDRGRRAENGVRDFLLVAARHGSVSVGDGNGNGYGGARGSLGRDAGSLAGARALLRGILCSEVGSTTGRGADTGWNRGVGGGRGGGSSGTGGGGENSGVASERGSQLLELALRWLEDGDNEENGGVSGGVSGGDGGGGGVEITAGELASEIISAVFDAIAGARPKVLRALLSGVFDRSQGGTACAGSYLRAWEALLTQEARQQVIYKLA